MKEKRKYFSTSVKKKKLSFAITLKDLLYLGAILYHPHDLRLFLDSSERSLKCVLNHNGNEYVFVPIGHSLHAKETYKNVK